MGGGANYMPVDSTMCIAPIAVVGRCATVVCCSELCISACTLNMLSLLFTCKTPHVQYSMLVRLACTDLQRKGAPVTIPHAADRCCHTW